MRVAPADVNEGTLMAELTRSWGLDLTEVTFVPEGFGSYHWKATTRDGMGYFVTVDDLGAKLWLGTDHDAVFAGLQAALDAAADLHERGGLGFVVGPVRTTDGRSVVRVMPQYGVSLFPYVDGTAGRWGDGLSGAEGRELVSLLAALHSSTAVVASRTPRYAEVLTERAELEAALRDAVRPWTGGPFSEPARAKLAEEAERVRGWLGVLDRLAANAGPSAELVITHGEPHPGNLIRTEGHLVLVDWDTVGLAPRERDLWMVDDGMGKSFDSYAVATGTVVDQTRVAMYRLAWVLKDLAAHLSLFRSPHDRTEDTEKAWHGLVEILVRGPDELLADRPPWRIPIV